MKYFLYVLVFVSLTCQAFAQTSFDTIPRQKIYLELSSKNDSCPIRLETKGIVLHFTAGKWPGCRYWLQRGPWTHFLITTTGHIEQIADPDRMVNHCGDSEWNGDTAFWRYSIGIEFEQYGSSVLTVPQLLAGRWLLDSLKRRYYIPDSMIVCHAAVACFYADKKYGRRVLYHYNKRGRKRDGIPFMNPKTRQFRRALGLGDCPTYDPDVVMGRMQPLKWQEKELYGHNFSPEELAVLRTKIMVNRTTFVIEPISPRPLAPIIFERDEQIEVQKNSMPDSLATISRKKTFFKKKAKP